VWNTEVSVKVRDLVGWPPDPARGSSYVLRGTATSHHNWVRFTCSFADKDHTYEFETPDQTLALQLTEIIKGNSGKTLFEVGDMEIQAD
jgi:hypothetical protein